MRSPPSATVMGLEGEGPDAKDLLRLFTYWQVLHNDANSTYGSLAF